MKRMARNVSPYIEKRGREVRNGRRKVGVSAECGVYRECAADTEPPLKEGGAACLAESGWKAVLGDLRQP